MQITLVTQPFAAIETDALVSYVFEETDLVQGRIAEIDRAAGGLLRKLAISRRTNTKPTRKTTRTSKLSCSLVVQTPNVRRQRRAFRKAASSPRRKTSLATSSTSRPTSSRRASWPKKPKPWPREPDLP